MNYNEEEEEEERVMMITRSRTRSCKVVEYLLPLMSKELLCKFPDNSAFDFDYTQSSIWSPMLPPRPYSPMDFDSITPRKLSYDFGFGFEFDNTKNNLLLKKKKKKKNIKNSEFFPATSHSKVSCMPKGWNKVLKAACKHFKKRKKDSVKLSNKLLKIE